MKAITLDRFGGRDVLKLTNQPLPEIGPQDILIHVKAAGVNPVDWKIREGLLQGRLPHQFPIILGWEASGVVKKVGEKVTRFKMGDPVMSYTRKDVIQGGAYAEYVSVPEKNATKKPENLSFEEAAALPLAGLTAYQSLFDALKLKSGETILIHAGAGGVGGFAIQLAKNTGAHIITTASSYNHEYVRSLGAEVVIDYNKENFAEIIDQKFPNGLDTVYDTYGEPVQDKSISILKKGGRFCSILEIPNADIYKNQGYKISYVFVSPNAVQLEELGELACKGRLKITITHIFPLEEAKRAHEQSETGHTRGKIILTL